MIFFFIYQPTTKWESQQKSLILEALVYLVDYAKLRRHLDGIITQVKVHNLYNGFPKPTPILIQRQRAFAMPVIVNFLLLSNLATPLKKEEGWKLVMPPFVRSALNTANIQLWCPQTKCNHLMKCSKQILQLILIYN